MDRATHANAELVSVAIQFSRETLLEPFTRGKLVTFVARVNVGDLNVIREMIEAGAVTPVIDRSYTLEETAEAVRYVAAGHTRGKVVIAIGGQPEHSHP